MYSFFFTFYMRYIDNTRKAFYEVYAEKKYVAISMLFGLVVFSLNAVIRNYRLLWSEFSFSLLFNLIISVHSTMSTVSFLFLIIVSLLSGIVLSLSLFLLRRQITYGAGIGLTGIVTSILTPACSSCALGLAGIIGVSGTLTLLPFKGMELGALGIVLLLISLVYLSGKITATVCEIKN